ncbi:MAG: hypothetical protein H6564_10125 [Lewinellaceae bacterium]|nr:hypothetical protein [Lewinellaceae bacterium]
MKTIYALLLLPLCYSCANPAKLLENGRPDTALEICLKRLERGRYKPKTLDAFQRSANLIAIRDRQLLEAWPDNAMPEAWPQVFEKTQQALHRQARMTAVLQALELQGITLVIDTVAVWALNEKARERSAIYYYARAQEYVPAARSGNRREARKAYGFLEQSWQYIPGFRQSAGLHAEMKQLGTTHILLKPMDNPFYGYRYDDRQQMPRLLQGFTFPLESGWQVIHLSPPAGQEMDYELEMYFESLYVSGDEEQVSTCWATAKVEEGFTTRREWSEKDSAYIEIKEPVIVDVSAAVTTVVQSKWAEATLILKAIGQRTGRELSWDRLDGDDTWSNEYSTITGDTRALSGQCPSVSGTCWMFPSDWQMLDDAVDDLRWSLRRRLSAGFVDE